jgi:hypothetical protein
MKRTSPLTPWFDASEAPPTRAGFYLIDTTIDRPGTFLYWDGHKWFTHPGGYPTSVVYTKWRGLTRPMGG